jgi:hypothetical protein
MHCGDIVIHIDESLDDSGIHDLERRLSASTGIVSACVHDQRRHLMLVDFDPADIKPSEIVSRVRNTGLHAEMIGL